MLDLFDELKTIVDSLTARRIDYAMCGGLAMAVHGLVRATVAIDLLISAESYAEVKDLTAKLGYTIEAPPMTFAGGSAEIRVLSKLDSDTGDQLMLDLLLVTPDIDGVWRSRTEIGWESGTVSVVSREGLLALKSLRSTAQDLIDIGILIETDPETYLPPKAVTVRLKRVSQLRRLCLSLAKAKPVHSDGPTRPADHNGT